MKKIILVISLLLIGFNCNALDVTQFVCSQPEMNKHSLKKACKSNSITAHTICQGNEAEVWCKSANLDIADISTLRVNIGFRNRHVPTKLFGSPVVLYDSKSTGYITLKIDSNCNIVNKNVKHSNTSAQIIQTVGNLFGYRVEKSIPNQVPGCI